MKYQNNKAKITVDVLKIVFPIIFGGVILKQGLEIQNPSFKKSNYTSEEIVELESSFSTDDDTISYLVQTCRIKDNKITNKSFYNNLPNVYQDIIDSIMGGNYHMSVDDCKKNNVSRIKQIEVEMYMLDYFQKLK